MNYLYNNILLIILSLILGINLSLAQNNYYSGFDNADERKDWQSFEKGKTGHEWKIGNGGINGSSKLRCIAPTGDADKDSLVNWYVSPKFDFSEGGSLDSLKYNYFCYFNTHFPEQSVQVYLLEDNADPALSSTKTLLLDLTDYYSGESTVWKDTGNITIPVSSSNSYIAFKFVAIDGWSTISFDNLHLTINKSSSVSYLAPNQYKVYPNPAQQHIKISVTADIVNEPTEIALYNCQGQLIKILPFNSEENVSLHLSAGLYLYEIRLNGIKSRMNKLIVE